LALLLTASGASGNVDALLRPNPGGGYFGANVNAGTINPSKVYDAICARRVQKATPWLGDSVASRLLSIAAAFPPIQTQRRL